MSREAAPAPTTRFTPLNRRQMLLCMWAGYAAYLGARHWLVPKWIARAESGQVKAAHAIPRAIDETAAIVLTSVGVVAFVCYFFNVIRRERQRRAEAAARELAFVTSLGHCAEPLSPSNETPRR